MSSESESQGTFRVRVHTRPDSEVTVCHSDSWRGRGGPQAPRPGPRARPGPRHRRRTTRLGVGPGALATAATVLAPVQLHHPRQQVCQRSTKQAALTQYFGVVQRFKFERLPCDKSRTFPKDLVNSIYNMNSESFSNILPTLSKIFYMILCDFVFFSFSFFLYCAGRDSFDDVFLWNKYSCLVV